MNLTYTTTMKHLLPLLILGVFPLSAFSDEGMWLPNDPPRARLKEKYGFELTEEFIHKAMAASIRFDGASGSFVSPDGLVVTNHHVGADAIKKLSTKERDLMRDGFLAKSREEELKCQDQELNVLQSIDDVTERVNAAVKADMTPAQAFAARRAIMAEIEKESLTKTGFKSDVVTLYQGGLYHLYRYKKYTDVRLVFAPETGIASFGGDVDNFEYPRHSLDVSFFRVYEEGVPAKIQHYFRWSETGPKENDLVFVTGHPGTTNRLETLAKLRHRRDSSLPYTLARLRALEAALHQFGEQSPESKRRALNDLHSVANARKALSGQLQGLLDPNILKQKEQQEETLKKGAGDGKLDRPFAVIADCQKKLVLIEKEFLLLERGDAFATSSFSAARHCVRLADELSKPSTDRLREYRDSALESLKRSLFAPAPFYEDLERKKLQTSLTFLAETLGGDDPLTVKILNGKNPERRAAELLAGTKLHEVAERKRLIDGGKKEIDASTDSMILLVKMIDEASRSVRKKYEEEIDEPERQAYAKISSERFRLHGRDVAPDATFTLRIAFGIVKGYEENGITHPAWTTFGGLFSKADSLENKEPFTPPERWRKGKATLDLETPFNFASTADTIGGNSGSPVLNQQGELVGINFDRNRFGLVRNFVYTDVQARHIAVHSRAVLTVLKDLYGADELVKELRGK